jgi:MFS family permease
MGDYRRYSDYLRPPSAAAVALSDAAGASQMEYRRAAAYPDYRRASPPPPRNSGGGWWDGAVVLRAALALGLGTFVSSIGTAGLGAPWTELLMQTACERQNITYPSNACNQSPLAQSEAAWRQEWMNLGTTIPQFLTVGIIAQMADSYGRKPAILVGVIAGIAFPLSIALIPFGPLCLGSICTDGFWYLLAVNIVTSFTGGQSACWAIQMTVMSDVSGSWSVEQRTMAFMLLEAAGAAGPIVGPVLGATLAEHYDLRAPFWFCSFTCLCQILLMLLCLKETLPDGEKKRFSLAASSPWRQMAAFFDHRIMICFFILIGPTAGLGGSVGVINNLYLMRVVNYSIMQLSYLMTFGTTIGKKTAPFGRFQVKNASFCQDRLGTNIGKTQKRVPFYCRDHRHDRRSAPAAALHAQPSDHDPLRGDGNGTDVCFRGAGVAGAVGRPAPTALARVDALSHTDRR